MIPDTILKKLRQHCDDDSVYDLLAALLAYEDENFANKGSSCEKAIEQFIKEHKK